MLRRTFVASLTLLCVTVSARAEVKPVTVGGKAYTEQQILAEITAQSLKANGFPVDLRTGLGSAALRQAQESGQVDVYWEYVGTSLLNYNKISERMSPQAAYERVRDLDAAKGLVWLDPSKSNSSYALAMRRETAESLGLKNLSDLTKALAAGAGLRFASNAEFYARPDGLRPLQKEYGFEFPRSNIVRMDTGLICQALRDKQVEIGVVLAQDGRIPAFDLVVLTDDRGFFPSYAAVPVARKDSLERSAGLANVLNRISARLNSAVVSELNKQVDVDGKSVPQVAAGFVTSNGLDKPAASMR